MRRAHPALGAFFVVTVAALGAAACHSNGPPGHAGTSAVADAHAARRSPTAGGASAAAHPAQPSAAARRSPAAAGASAATHPAQPSAAAGASAATHPAQPPAAAGASAATHPAQPSAAAHPAQPPAAAQASSTPQSNDAQPPATAPAPTATARTPASGFHLDSDHVEYVPPPRRHRHRHRHRVGLILRSTPPGAVAAVDGVDVGRTPTYYMAPTDGRAHDFTFVLPGYEMGRYRFVVLRAGIVHATLNKLPQRPPDAGAAHRPAHTGSTPAAARR